MKKIVALFLAVALAFVCGAAAFAQQVQGGEIKISGEAKSGIYWQETQTMGDPVDRVVKVHNNDDAGSNQGRFRLNMDFEREDGFGMRTRFQFHDWRNDPGYFLVYGFAYGNFFENQLTVSVGRLGGSAWGTGGPEMWKELEESTIGMRVEWKPAFIPEEYGKINAGFTLGDFNSDMDQGITEAVEKVTIMEILQESVLGISYTHEWGLVRFAYRLDSFLDAKQDNKGEDAGKGEDEIVYRVEERILTNYVSGLQLWAFGYLYGLRAREDLRLSQNWFIAQYEPPELGNLQTPFTAQLRFGYNAIASRGEMFVKPIFYWHFFNKLISAGAAFTYAQDFGDDKIQGDHPYYYIQIEPKIQFNFNSSYIAFVYNWKKEYFHDHLAVPGYDPIKQTQFMNLRFCIYY